VVKVMKTWSTMAFMPSPAF